MEKLENISLRVIATYKWQFKKLLVENKKKWKVKGERR
jgi:hypothetical protein